MSDGDLSGVELNGIGDKEAKESSNNCVLNHGSHRGFWSRYVSL